MRKPWAVRRAVGITCAIGLLALLGVEGLSVGTTVIAKSLYAALIAALVTPYLALYALASGEEPAAGTEQAAR